MMKGLKEISFIVPSLAPPRTAHACAVCFGAGDNPAIPRAFTWGILVLLAFTFAILGTIAVAVYRLEARRNAQPHDP